MLASPLAVVAVPVGAAEVSSGDATLNKNENKSEICQ